MRARIDRAVAAMRRLPARAGVTYRACAGEDLDDLSTWAVNAVLADRGFLATTREPALALTFGAVVLRVTGRSGRDLTGLSRFPLEAEVVYLPGTAFVVTAVHRDSATQRVLVDLTETDIGEVHRPAGSTASVADLPELSATESQLWQRALGESAARIGRVSGAAVNVAKWSEPVGLRPSGGDPATPP